MEGRRIHHAASSPGRGPGKHRSLVAGGGLVLSPSGSRGQTMKERAQLLEQQAEVAWEALQDRHAVLRHHTELKKEKERKAEEERVQELAKMQARAEAQAASWKDGATEKVPFSGSRWQSSLSAANGDARDMLTIFCANRVRRQSALKDERSEFLNAAPLIASWTGDALQDQTQKAIAAMAAKKYAGSASPAASLSASHVKGFQASQRSLKADFGV
mmetsp:Transcript_76879/g.135441  ORF Transcript_76879/g.135441 Transcript_76879/m.135441 type:complete len:216 (+) Transcript_76879:81-728(+)